jgi:hypothetical protein
MTLPILEAIEQAERSESPVPGTIVLQRQGISHSVNGAVPGGFVEINQAHGVSFDWLARYWYQRGDDEEANRWCNSKTFDRRAEAVAWLERTIEEHTGQRVTLSPAVEAGYYYNDRTRGQNQQTQTDWYRAVFLYDAEREALVWPDGRIVASFLGDSLGVRVDQYEQLLRRAYHKYQKPHNHRHQSQREARCWMAWLAGSYALDAGAPWVWRQSLEHRR